MPLPFARPKTVRGRAMRLLLIPLLLALAVILAAILLATPPTASAMVGPATQHQDRRN
jgi:hypothetical protein